MLPNLNIAPATDQDNFNSPISPPLPLLPHIPKSQHQAVLQAFLDTIHAGVVDPPEVIRSALLALRGQLRGRWQPGRDVLRTTLIVIMAHPNEAHALAQTLLSQREGRDGQ